ncbi:MAG: hypothetical protein ACTSVI_13625 [Promethearchaeota archaeon]
MGKKRKLVYEGFLTVEDIKNIDPNDKDLKEYWSRIKNYLIVLGDVDTQQVVFLNREFKKIAKRFEGFKVRITIEAARSREDIDAEGDALPDIDEEYKGFEKFKRVLMDRLNIS